MTTTTPSTLAKWELHLQALHKQFHELASGQCLLWVNPAQADLFAENGLVQERKVRVPISHPRFDLQYAPYLVLLNLASYADSDVFKKSVQAAYEAWDMDNLQAMNGQPVCGWIITEAAPQDLAQYWAHRCHLHQLGSLTKNLRFHDPSVREWLWPELSPEQQSILLGPARIIFAICRNQKLMRHESGNLAALKPNASINTVRLALTARQWASVDDYTVLHAAWLQLCSADKDCRHALDQKGRWAQATLTALEEATQYGIHDPADRKLFAMHALQLGGTFHLHPELRPVWEKTLTGDFYGCVIEETFNTSADELNVETLNQASSKAIA